MATIIQNVNIRQVLNYLAPGKNYGWNPATGTDSDPDHGHTMDVVTWRDTGEKPTEAEVIVEWDAHSDRYETVTLSATPNGNFYDIAAELQYNIDGVTELTFKLNGIDMPEATALVGNVATITFNPTVGTIIGITDNYPHEKLFMGV